MTFTTLKSFPHFSYVFALPRMYTVHSYLLICILLLMLISPATRCFFSPTLQAITDFTMSLDDNTENATWPLSSIGDLSYFLSNPTDQEPYFVCKARIVDVLGQHGWYYVCCTQCSKEMVKSAASLRCDQCGNTNDTGVVRYRVELLVDDGNNYATFVVFDKEMLEMTNQHAATLFLSEVNVGLDDKLPQCVSGLEGQTFVFHIRVKPCNSTQNYSPFTVSAISHNIDTKDFNIKESPCVDLRCDEPSTPPPANNTLTAEVQEGERSCSRE
ncbi:uncharacterized protein LOC106374615 isoform X1 [Brassica napus]|uniref:uncharacterized protein LOC106374615 isoform X1 n=1 Tax=Brassica napus TaxID=3708 RepID=UPI00207A16E2|nr:uncharacterized protein LOC106374615 isoform X1 [Brassica napus]